MRLTSLITIKHKNAGSYHWRSAVYWRHRLHRMSVIVPLIDAFLSCEPTQASTLLLPVICPYLSNHQYFFSLLLSSVTLRRLKGTSQLFCIIVFNFGFPNVFLKIGPRWRIAGEHGRKVTCFSQHVLPGMCDVWWSYWWCFWKLFNLPIFTYYILIHLLPSKD